MSVEFQPHLVTLAREAAGLTQGAVAVGAQISQALISKIENGLESASRDVLERIAVECEVPIEFFYQPEPILGEGLVDIFHKKRLTLPAKPLKRANAIVNVTRMEALRLMRTLELNDVSEFPTFPLDEHESIEEVAQLVRATWRIPAGPLPDLIALVEAAAIPIFLLPLGHEKLSAISLPGANGEIIIVLNRDLPPSARRFALAHEIGHLVLQHGAASTDMERDADKFASALLMPAEDIKRSLRNVKFRDLGALKPIWRVSIAALIYRAHDLGEITDRHYRTLNMQLSQMPGGRKHEPGEFRGEEPRLIPHILSHYQDDLSYSVEDLTKLMVMKESVFREKYLGETARPLRAVGSERPAHQLSVIH